MYMRRLLGHESVFRDPLTATMKFLGVIPDGEEVVDIFVNHLLTETDTILLIATTEELINAVFDTTKLRLRGSQDYQGECAP